MKVIGFSGKARFAKTTCAQFLKDYITDKKVDIVPLAKKMKQQAMDVGWDGKKDKRGRRLLQEISWPIKHYHGEDIYAKWCYEQAKEENLDILLIDDVRMNAEVEYFEKLKAFEEIEDFVLVRIERPGFISDLSAEALKDVSETQLDNYPFDHVIINDGSLDDLQQKVIELYNKL